MQSHHWASPVVNASSNFHATKPSGFSSPQALWFILQVMCGSSSLHALWFIFSPSPVVHLLSKPCGSSFTKPVPIFAFAICQGLVRSPLPSPLIRHSACGLRQDPSCQNSTSYDEIRLRLRAFPAKHPHPHLFTLAAQGLSPFWCSTWYCMLLLRQACKRSPVPPYGAFCKSQVRIGW